MFNLPPKYANLEINSELETILNEVFNTDHNLNIIGAAGSGKTTLLKLLTDNEVLPGRKVVLSTTGIAAINASADGIKGSTIHHFFGLPPRTIYTPQMISIQNEALQNVINNIDYLFIDEVSMMNASFFDFLCELLTYYRSKRTYGIPRMFLFGDILQLPPVLRNTENEKDVKKYFDTLYNGKTMYFSSFSFRDYAFKTIHLTKIYRQENNSFQNILNRIRQGTQTDEDLAIINSQVIDEGAYFDKHEMYIYLATTNDRVDIINESYMKVLEGKEYKYYGYIEGNFNLKARPSLQETLTLKVGMQVVCLWNNESDGYRNGTLGKVKYCNSDSVVIEDKNKKLLDVKRATWSDYAYSFDPVTKDVLVNTVGSFHQIALRGASALTIHKAMGQEFSDAFIDFGPRVFGEGMAYVALSRLKSLEGLGLERAITHKDIKVSKEALEFLSSI